MVSSHENLREVEFLEHIVNSTAACVAVVEGRELRYTLVNSKFQEFHPQPLTGRRYRDAFPEAAAAGAEAKMLAVLETGEPWDVVNYPAKVPLKPDAVWEGRVVRLTVTEGREPSLLAVFWDVTERAKAEEESLAKTRLNQILLDAFPCVALLLRPESHVIVAMNKKAALEGCVIGQTCYGSWAKRSTPCPWCLAPVVWKTGKPQSSEPSDGGITWDAHWIRISEDLYMHFAFDITDRRKVEKALIESETKYRELFENAQIGMFISRLDGSEMLDANERYLEMLGLSRAEFIGKPSRDFWANPLQREKMVNILKSEGRVTNFECQLITKHNGVRDFLTSLTLNPDNKTLHGSIIDITERKKAEDDLNESEHFTRTLLNTTPELIYVHDIRTNSNVYANRSVMDFLGYTSGEVQAMGSSLFNNILHPDDANLVAVHHSRCAHASDDDILELTYRMKNRDGKWRYLRSRDVPFRRDTVGNVTQILGVTEDITEQLMKSRMVEESEAKFRAVFENAHEGIVLIDYESGTIVDCNPEYERQTGRDQATLKKMKIWEIRPPDQKEQNKVIFERIKKTGGGRSSETGYQRPDGTIIPIEFTSSIVEMSGRKYFLGVTRDISEKKKAEIEQQRFRDKAEMAARLAAVGEMASGIAHEINNPLTGVVGFSELLVERDDLPDEVREDLKIIRDGGRRVKEIVGRMLTFARQQKPLRVASSITELIDNTLEIRSYVLKTANIEVIKDYSPNLPWLIVDPGQLQQVFLNIIVNAEYAMKQAHNRGKLTIKAENCGEIVRFSFTDDGPGMSRETLSKLFQPFFTTKAPGEGTGLGLALSYGIIKEHDGTIKAESSEGCGSTFVIDLPIGFSVLPVQEGDSTNPVASIRFASSNSRVLVIDDEDTVRSVTKAILERNGYDTATEPDPLVALERLKTEHFDAVLCDIRIPDLSGMELYERLIRENPELAKKVIFITGDVSDAATREYLESHDIPFITKPFDQDSLLNKIWDITSKGG
ncbi:PAS domain S-box-containing protein [Dehalogenimonas formicexedens]|uniref:histidine kinase n=1 Tax=Dehalogenimonas formicexedens TaxID=1839801 RepID=A0A1P8F877_9CHLR|nr:PAS domain S-box protein [Dehalogenimonas formicexedens]APV44679.1 PAS domain S-box-containing protein [Dehalogenimonas formicexedens]